LEGIRTENTYDFSEEWSVPFGEFDEFFFSTFNFKHWLYITKFEAIGEKYTTSIAPRVVSKSSLSESSYTASWDNRDNVAEDPWIGLKSHGTTGDFIVYAENSHSSNHWSLASITSDGGMCVWVRSSTSAARSNKTESATTSFSGLVHYSSALAAYLENLDICSHKQAVWTAFRSTRTILSLHKKPAKMAGK